MWDSTDKSALVAGIARSQRLAALLSSPVGEDIRSVILMVAQSWFERMRKGELGAHLGFEAIEEFVRVCDMMITLGEGMQLELVKRQGEVPNGYARAAAE